MKTISKGLCIIISVIIVYACGSPNPNMDVSGQDQLKSHEVEGSLRQTDKAFEDIIYVPIYSDIYLNRTNQSSLLAATLSIRNTSLTDTLFVSMIDYYNTEGSLVKQYLDQPLFLNPMATINYVIEKEDTSGGPGANFIVKLNSNNKNIKPIIEAVMVGTDGNKAFSFLSQGYSIK